MIRPAFHTILAVLSVVLVPHLTEAQTVRFDTNLGNIDVELFGDDAPGTVFNFLTYVNAGEYDATIIHRKALDFVVQGGGFLEDGSAIATHPEIVNEFGNSNLRGTIAMARRGGEPDSASSQFFFNTTDNTGLDGVDGGFTVFGEVVNGLDIVDVINALTSRNLNPSTDPFGPFGEVPILDDSDPGFADNLVVVRSVRVIAVPEPSGAIFLLISLTAHTLHRRRR